MASDPHRGIKNCPGIEMIIYQTILKENEQPTWAGSSSPKLPPAHPPSLASAHLAKNPLPTPVLDLVNSSFTSNSAEL